MIEEFSKYIINVEVVDIDIIRDTILHEGLEKAVNTRLEDMDCTRVCPNGMRINQTINYQYRKAISCLYYIINNYCDEETKNSIENKMINIHQNNIEFEKTTPPIVYSKSKTKKAKIKSDSPKEPKKEKLSAEDKKAIRLKEKFASVNFKFKPKQV